LRQTNACPWSSCLRRRRRAVAHTGGREGMHRRACSAHTPVWRARGLDVGQQCRILCRWLGRVMARRRWQAGRVSGVSARAPSNHSPLRPPHAAPTADHHEERAVWALLGDVVEKRHGLAQQHFWQVVLLGVLAVALLHAVVAHGVAWPRWTATPGATGAFSRRGKGCVCVQVVGRL
jgi:hypothetical protein